MKTKVSKKRDSVIKKLLSDEKFLSNLSISQQLKFMNKVHNAKSTQQIDNIVNKSKKLKRK